MSAHAAGLPSAATSYMRTQSTDVKAASLGWPLDPDPESTPPTAEQDILAAFTNARSPGITTRVCRESLQSSHAFCIWLCYSDLSNEYGLGGWGPPPLSPSPPPYSIQPVSGYGLGMVANRPIKTGETILIERPIAVHPSVILTEDSKGPLRAMEDRYEAAFPALGEKEKSVYMELYNCKPLTGTLGNKFNGIARTNGIHIRFTRSRFLPHYAGVFPTISRLNHSCGPNADSSFDEDSMTMRLFAFRPIAAGEQVTISYVTTLLPTTLRQKELNQKYVFTCECKYCKPTVASSPSRPLKHPYWTSLPKGIRSTRTFSPSDIRRIQICFHTTKRTQDMWAEWASPSSKETDRIFFEFHEDALVVLAQEGLEDKRIDHIAYLAHGCAALGDAGGFQRWGNVLISLSAWAHGKKGILQMKTWQDWVREPTTSPAWGLRVASTAKGKQKSLV